MQKAILRGLLCTIFSLAGGLASAATLFPRSTLPSFGPIEPSRVAQSAELPRTAQLAGPSSPGWISRCVSESRKGPVECLVEETLAMASNGQLVAMVAVKVQPKEQQPIMTIKVPAGLYLPAGLSVQVDDGKPQSVILQTCNAQGCDGEIHLTSNLLAALKTGKKLSLTFQNMAKATVSLPFPLDNFANAFQKIQ